MNSCLESTRVKSLVWFTALLLTSSCLGQLRYRLITLGTLDNTDNTTTSTAYILNNQLEIVGQAEDGLGRQRPTLWLRENSTLIGENVDGQTLTVWANDLGTFLAENDGEGVAEDINDAGFITGRCDDEIDEVGIIQAFVWSPIDFEALDEGKTALIHTVDFARQTIGRGISEIDTGDDDHFIVVGQAATEISEESFLRGFIWDSDTMSLEVALLPPGTTTALDSASAADINLRPTNDRVIGGYSTVVPEEPSGCTTVARSETCWGMSATSVRE